MSKSDWVEVLRPDLDATGLPWEAVAGKKHWKIYMQGRMIMVLSRGAPRMKSKRETDNARAAIKRAARDQLCK